MQVQDIVVGNKNFTDVTKPSEIVQLLLNEDQLAGLNAAASVETSSKKSGKKAAAATQNESGIRELWNEEGDDFFGNSGGPTIQELDDEGTPVPTVSGRGRKKGDGTVSRRGRKPGPKPGRKKATAAGS